MDHLIKFLKASAASQGNVTIHTWIDNTYRLYLDFVKPKDTANEIKPVSAQVKAELQPLSKPESKQDLVPMQTANSNSSDNIHLWRVYVYELSTGKFIGDFASQKEAAEWNKVPQSSISRCLLKYDGKLEKHGLLFKTMVPSKAEQQEQLKLEDLSIDKSNWKEPDPVMAICDGKFHTQYHSKWQAATKNGLNYNHFCKVMREEGEFDLENGIILKEGTKPERMEVYPKPVVNASVKI